ncbi:ABC transporter permease [Methanobrevibacter curvatus]|jgi:NitT/TauT family transport system permease protein|uniref:Putative aliphatic sulfonates transport permease protein SsuC n=1 Tax=Methanobrevibacter curvatus TaxID=49547 RepID=A0A166AV68_9EURY|nr:ABC transporter permease [Methanobrevibacter curvatus]KZX12509.1 putative aliphatic sulfonates transport permease protein SsuC [Methanobrevibacter curvatus]MDR3063594.1 ABC transporter permease [Methanobrevibacter sp.]
MKIKNKFLPLIIPIIIIVVWIIGTSILKLVPTFVVPDPLTVFDSGEELIFSGRLLRDTIDTLFKVLLGLLTASIVAIPLGILLGSSSRLEEMSKIIVGVLRPIPPVAWIPFSILWFGIGTAPAIFIIFMGSVFPILIYTLDGVKRTDKVLIEAGETLGANRFQILTRIIFPAAIPTIVSGLKVAVGIGLMCTVSAEMIASDSGLGHLIINASNLFDTGATVIGMVTIGIIGLMFDFIFRKIEGKVFW